ncbi:MAG: ATP-binding protein [Pedobacter sp.]
MNWRPSYLWNRLRLLTQLLLVTLLCLLIVLIGAAFQSIRYLVDNAQIEMAAEHRHNMDLLEIAVAPALIADATTHDTDSTHLKRVLENFHRSSTVTHISFHETSDALIFSHDTPIVLKAPLWFSRWCGQEEIRANRPVVIEGQYYGVITLSISPLPAINEAWREYLEQVKILLLAFGLLLLSLLWLLRQGLLPLKALTTVSDAFGRGDLSARLDMRGSSDLQTVFEGFNLMADRIETAQKTLQESEKEFRLLAEAMPQIVWITRPDGGNIYFNPQWVEYTGQTLEESRGQGWTKPFHPDDQQRAWDIWQNAVNNQTEYSLECRLRRSDGVYKWWLIRGVPVLDADGKILKWFGTCTDIDEFKKAAEEKLALIQQLHQAQKMESVGSLAGGVAHDFNNKLSVILGYAYMAFTESDPVKIKNFLEEIRKAAEQSADLTRQLLAFARKQTIAPKVLDLNETVTGMLKMLNRLIGENIRLTWQPAPDLWLLKFDPSQVDQILANLCVNARDSITTDGKITIETGNCTIDEEYCAHHAGSLPGEYVCLVVSDNGCGMSNEILRHIFEPFFTTKEMGKGTGLGLATVFGIVKQNNGYINVYSEPDIGTTFTIYLPRHLGNNMRVEKKNMAIPAPVGLETILLVEDELAILNIASMILTKQGYTVLSANTPTEAIRLAKENAGEIDLLITDVIMPDMNGKDLTNNLQFLYPGLKSLYMSGYTADAIALHGVLDDGVNFIQKPFSLPDLAIKVREVLDGK